MDVRGSEVRSSVGSAGLGATTRTHLTRKASMMTEIEIYSVGEGDDHPQPPLTILVDSQLVAPPTLTLPPGPDGRPQQ